MRLRACRRPAAIPGRERAAVDQAHDLERNDRGHSDVHRKREHPPPPFLSGGVAPLVLGVIGFLGSRDHPVPDRVAFNGVVFVLVRTRSRLVGRDGVASSVLVPVLAQSGR